MHFLLRYILRKPILLAILLLQAASLLHGATSYENLANYVDETFSQEKLSQLHHDGVFSEKMVSQLANLKEHVLDVAKNAYQKFVASRKTPVLGINDSLELTQKKFTYLQKNIEALQTKISSSKRPQHEETQNLADLQNQAQQRLESLKNYGKEHGLSSKAFQKSEKGSDPIVSEGETFDHRTKINELKEAARNALQRLAYNQIALDKNQWDTVASYGLLNKKYPSKSFTPQKSSNQAQEELANAFFSNIEGIYDHINELSAALTISESHPVLGVGLSLWLRIPKNEATSDLVEQIKAYYKLDEDTDQYLQISQEFDIVTNTDLIECKRVTNGIEEYIPNLKRQQLFTKLVQNYLHKWNFESELAYDRVIELVQGKKVYCCITYKQAPLPIQKNSADEFEKMLSQSSSRAESRATGETRILSQGIGVDNGDAYICPLNIADCSQDISDTSAKSAISALLQAKKDALIHSDRPLILHIIMKDEQTSLLNKLLEFAGFITPKQRERRNSAPEISRATPTLHHVGTPPITSSMQQRKDTPTTPLGILRSPAYVLSVHTITPDRQTPRMSPASPVMTFDNTPPVSAHKPTPERTPPRKKVSSLHDTTQPEIENQPGSSCAKKLPL